MKINKLRMAESAYRQLRDHLFPGDGLEAVAFALCGVLKLRNEETLSVHSVFLYPHQKCTVREGDRVEWSPAEVVELFETCRKKGFILLKIHSHPEHWPFFSKVDDKSDIDLGSTVACWTGRDDKVCSVIMLPDGSMIGRVVDANSNFADLDTIIVIGDNISCFHTGSDHNVTTDTATTDDIQLRTKQTFGEGTSAILQKLKIGVVGCSGTGSIVAELLVRLGVGSVVLVDPDKVEHKNINRILNSTVENAEDELHKVDMLKDAFERIGTKVNVISIPNILHSSEAYLEIASCDIVFGCMDTVDGRHLLNRIATYFCIGYFDVGIRLDADGKGGINEILGRVDYIRPGGSSLLSRGRYTLKQLSDADMARTNPDEFARQVKEGYIKAANVQSPAVISINMMFSSQAVTELLARLHPFRDRNNENYAAVTFSVSGFLLIAEKDGEPDKELLERVGLGSRKLALDAPLLILPTKT